MPKRFFFLQIDTSTRLLMKQSSSIKFLSSILTRYLSQNPEAESIAKSTTVLNDNRESRNHSTRIRDNTLNDSDRFSKDSSDDDNENGWKWKLESPWLSKALEPALQLFKWASATETGDPHKPTSGRSLAKIYADLQRNKVGIQDWSLGDLTVGLYLVYLRQASDKKEDVKGVEVHSDSLVQDLIYHIELAKGTYKGNPAGLAKHSMLQEKNIVKFVKDSSVMRPGYYIGIDVRNKLVVFGIRGTHTVYDIITDMVSSSDQKDILFGGFSSHFGTAEAARWFLFHELRSIRHCMEKHEGFRLRLVGHSLGGAAAALLAIMLRKKSAEELGFDPELVSAVGFGTPPCLSKELAESCSSYVSTVVMQDDIIPRLSVASLTRLRTEIIQTDWTSVLEREDFKNVVDWISNAKQAVSVAQDVAQKVSNYAQFSSISNASVFPTEESARSTDCVTTTNVTKSAVSKRIENRPDELFIPGTLYCLKKQSQSSNEQDAQTYTLWKIEAGQHFQRILLSGNLISDHKCESHYYALREVLKGLPLSNDRSPL